MFKEARYISESELCWNYWGDRGWWRLTGRVRYDPLIIVSYVTVAQQRAQNCKIPRIGVWDITAIMSYKLQELCSSVMETRNCYEEVTNLVAQRLRRLRDASEFIILQERSNLRYRNSFGILHVQYLYSRSITYINTGFIICHNYMKLGWTSCSLKPPNLRNQIP
jgi:hypothetical protein